MPPHFRLRETWMRCIIFDAAQLSVRTVDQPLLRPPRPPFNFRIQILLLKTSRCLFSSSLFSRNAFRKASVDGFDIFSPMLQGKHQLSGEVNLDLLSRCNGILDFLTLKDPTCTLPSTSYFAERSLYEEGNRQHKRIKCTALPFLLQPKPLSVCGRAWVLLVATCSRSDSSQRMYITPRPSNKPRADGMHPCREHYASCRPFVAQKISDDSPLSGLMRYGSGPKAAPSRAVQTKLGKVGRFVVRPKHRVNNRGGADSARNSDALFPVGTAFVT